MPQFLYSHVDSYTRPPKYLIWVRCSVARSRRQSCLPSRACACNVSARGLFCYAKLDAMLCGAYLLMHETGLLNIA